MGTSLYFLIDLLVWQFVKISSFLGINLLMPGGINLFLEAWTYVWRHKLMPWKLFKPSQPFKLFDPFQNYQLFQILSFSNFLTFARVYSLKCFKLFFTIFTVILLHNTILKSGQQQRVYQSISAPEKIGAPLRLAFRAIIRSGSPTSAPTSNLERCSD